MLPYWIIFILAALVAISAGPRTLVFGDHYYKNKLDLAWIAWICILLIYIGLRWSVGGDWGSYKWSFWEMSSLDLMKVITRSSDPGFGVLQWITGKKVLNLGYHGLNFISALIFCYGFAKFCKSLPRPYLALVVGLPYLVNVVAMGYMRQSIAISIAMLAILKLFKEENTKFFFLILLAACFHKSSIILFPLAIFVSTKNKPLIFIGAVILVAVGYLAFVESEIDRFLTYYIGQGYSSGGGAVRVAMLLPPAAIFILFKDRFQLSDIQKKLWLVFSYGAFPLFFAVIFLDISTTIDRIALYALPLQLVVFSYFPDLLTKNTKIFGVLFVILYYALVMYVWLNYANHASAWVPYENILTRLWTGEFIY
jgi:hypothetical protein